MLKPKHMILLLLAVGCLLMIVPTPSHGLFDRLIDVSHNVVFTNEPLPPISSENTFYPMQLSNGSAYMCVVPTPSRGKPNTPSSFKANSPVPAHITHSIHKAFRGWCLSSSEERWTYRLCWNVKVEQIHLNPMHLSSGKLFVMEKSSTMTRFVLGVAPVEESAEFFYGVDPSNERYIYTTYNNGDRCGTTQLLRSTEIRLYCPRSSTERKLHVQETSLCHYITNVVSKRACIAELQRVVTHGVIKCYGVSHRSNSNSPDVT